MKISIIEDPTLDEEKVLLYCLKRTKNIERLKCYGESLETHIIGVADEKQYILEPNSIYYFESVEDQTFVYLKNKVLKCSLRLYELENGLSGQDFVRISKSVLINLQVVKSIIPLMNRNLILELKNSEQVICSRRYAQGLKKVLEEISL